MKGGKQEGKDMEIIFIILHIQWYKNGTVDGDRKFNNIIFSVPNLSQECHQ